MGKLPRKAGLTLVRNNEQFDFTLQAELFSFGSAKIRQVGNDSDASDNFDRVESIRQLAESFDQLFDEFCTARFSDKWSRESGKIKSWLDADRKSSSKARSQKAA